MRIYIGNKEIAGYFTRLKVGFDKIGVKSDLWFLVDNKYFDVKTNLILKLNQKLFKFYKTNKKTILFPLVIPVVMMMIVLHALILIYALFKYDVFILNSEPFFNYWELAIIKAFNKKIIIVFLGTESRPSYLSGNNIQDKYWVEGKFDLERCYNDVKAQYKRLALIEKYADHIINHPPTALFQKKPFIAWLHIGCPNDTPTISPVLTQNMSRIAKVLHAPTNSVAKGTEKIIDIIDKLRKEGLPVELLKLENVPNEKVLDELTKCDFVVDELYSDIPIGGLGTEAAFALKPVINSSYYTDGISTDYPEDVIPPALFGFPENLEHDIKEYVLNKELREEHALKLNHFVRTKWESATIANKYMMIINGSIPDEWMFDPYKIEYYLGYGIEKNKLRSFLNQYISQFGEKALFLDDKPRLKSKILYFLKGNA